jgi:hypothetical protein
VLSLPKVGPVSGTEAGMGAVGRPRAALSPYRRARKYSRYFTNSTQISSTLPLASSTPLAKPACGGVALREAANPSNSTRRWLRSTSPSMPRNRKPAIWPGTACQGRPGRLAHLEVGIAGKVWIITLTQRTLASPLRKFVSLPFGGCGSGRETNFPNTNSCNVLRQKSSFPCLGVNEKRTCGRWFSSPCRQLNHGLYCR